MASIDKRPNGTWRARYREYPGGPQKTKTFDRKVDATRWLTTIEASLLSGHYVDPLIGRTTLRVWTERHVERQAWAPNTRSSAKASLGHALEVLGDRPLSAIRKSDVQAMLASIDRKPSTVRLVRQHLYGVMAAAVEDGLIARNPVAGVRVALGAGGEVVPPTVEEVHALHEAAPEWFKVAIVLGAGLGLRQAEASGLTADRIDWLRDRTVRIDRQWSTKVRPFHFAPPKSDAGTRTIPAADVVLAQLGAHVTDPAGFVLNREGEAVSHNVFGFAWRATVKAAGLEGVKFHDLRHHFASSLISAGCSVKAVQKALGHSSAAITLDVYGHLWPGDEDRIRAAIEASLFAAEDSLRTEASGGDG